MVRNGVPIDVTSANFAGNASTPVWSPWARARQRDDARPHAAREQARLIRSATEARAALREAADAATAAAAQARSVVQALDEALAALNAPESGQRAYQPASMAQLSPREQEVLSLVAEGRSNKAIADALFVSPNTVKTHVAALLAKLNANTRVQLATIATQEYATLRNG